ncbi:AIC_G0051200.mRNA.1.CDS.1 [Saccharomyces cerevisiae]|nr:Sec63p [Saccharomyces cerevisiae YJM270]PTN18467.1 protein-transporting protein SEC63 [Saccharomyces cerevisiae]PTN41262.1 protein-transporting protein SEC63 [Saccharomyces cerevisiae]CAI4782601.1 AIC_G0051200.mRNA.1.CDS.1 [Saccharomyces cerevisiae]CAI4826634.1 AFI_G0053280.mRNA.1.CDS.1 [Saccharomyces cerevisiae]
MPTNYEYDEASETWPSFILTGILMVVGPMTLLQIYQIFFGANAEDGNSGKSKEFNEEVFKNLNEEYTSDEIKQFRRKFDKNSNKKSKIWSRRNIIIIVGWILVAILLQRINSNDVIKDAATKLFDPYEILGISTSASDRDIKSAYRKLSVKFHPDKLAKGLTPDEKSVMEETYVQITKAYESLTDELVRQNYLKYGHPDGPQSTSHGIALPRFLVDGSVSPLLVVCYVALLGLILPYFVSRWWARTQSYTKKGIHNVTASNFVSNLVNYKPSEIVTTDLILHWLSFAHEFKQFFPDLQPTDFEKLLQDHINRRDSGKLNNAKFRIVAKCHSLLHGLLDIACGFRNLDIALGAINTFKCIVQAVPLTPNCQILQLPNVDKEHFITKTGDIHTLGKLFTLEDAKIGEVLGIKDQAKLNETLRVASHIPNLKIIKADFLVPGENQVTPSSTPYISLKVLVRSAKQPLIPTSLIPEENLTEPQDFESQRDPFAMMSKQPLVPYSFAPFFPTKRRGSWCCLVSSQKDGKILQTPIIIEKLSYKNLNDDKDFFDKRIKMDLTKHEKFDINDWEIGTIKIPLGQPAPETVGDFFFRVIVKSTDYFTTDLDITMNMKVRDSPAVEQVEVYSEEDDEYSTDDDETESDDESDASDYTDIDTDTEAEDDESPE